MNDMPVNEIHVGDVGTVLTTTIKDGSSIIDISGATLTFYFKKPNNTVVSKAGVLVSDGSDGQVKYTTESGFLDVAGTWYFQARVLDGDNSWKSDVAQFKVYTNLA